MYIIKNTYLGHILYFPPFLGMCRGARHCPLNASRHSFSEMELPSRALSCSAFSFLALSFLEVSGIQWIVCNIENDEKRPDFGFQVISEVMNMRELHFQGPETREILFPVLIDFLLSYYCPSWKLRLKWSEPCHEFPLPRHHVFISYDMHSWL